MAIIYPYVVRCGCGETITANLADGVNVGRTPQIREEILKGTFHKVSCPHCKQTVTAEKSFFYTDLQRGTFIQVKPRHDRHLWKTASQALDHAMTRVPDELSPSDRRKIRVVFGMAELREKLVAEDLGLDDRAVELLKALALNEHPFLLQKPRLRLALDAETPEELQFIASYDLDLQSFRLGLPREAAREIAGDGKRLRQWTGEAGHRNPLLDMKEDHWVNMWRWSPHPGALNELQKAAADLRVGKAIDMNSDSFRAMLQRLPRGSQLPGWAKQDLQLLFNEAKRRGEQDLQDALFEIRFAKTLADDWSNNSDLDDIDTLWQLLRALPASNVEGNTSINEIRLTGGDGGSYEPKTGDIYIGSRLLSDREDFEDIIRHEVGHGVHEAHSDEVNAWLADAFGWEMFTPDAEGLDRWVGLMGGWDRFKVPPERRGEIRQFLSSALGSGLSWNPGPTPNVPPGHPWWQADFGPRVAYQRSGTDWYLHHSNWYRWEGRAFFLNFWYRTLCVVNEDTLALVLRMPSPYAAMSTFEFFAELYALYFDLDNPRRQVIPVSAMEWLASRLGDSAESVARPDPPRRREPWESIARPH